MFFSDCLFLHPPFKMYSKKHRGEMQIRSPYPEIHHYRAQTNVSFLYYSDAACTVDVLVQLFSSVWL